VSGQLHAQATLSPEKQPPVPMGYEAGWAPEPVWTTWRREKSCPYRYSKSDPSAVQQPIAIPTELSRLPIIIRKITKNYAFMLDFIVSTLLKLKTGTFAEGLGVLGEIGACDYHVNGARNW
jgi:hypothetical protein